VRTIEPYTTGWAFDEWKEREGQPFVWKVPGRTSRPGVAAAGLALADRMAPHGLMAVREVPGDGLTTWARSSRGPACASDGLDLQGRILFRDAAAMQATTRRLRVG
jgi:hypothetical protein